MSIHNQKKIVLFTKTKVIYRRQGGVLYTNAAIWSRSQKLSASVKIKISKAPIIYFVFVFVLSLIDIMNIMALNLHTSSQKNILDLNDDAILAILSYLSYDEVAKLRLVNMPIFNHFLAQNNIYFIIDYQCVFCLLGLPEIQWHLYEAAEWRFFKCQVLPY